MILGGNRREASTTLLGKFPVAPEAPTRVHFVLRRYASQRAWPAFVPNVEGTRS